MRRAWLLAHIPFVALLTLIAPIIWPHDGVGDTFRFWYAGHIVATGGSPYDQSLWAAAGATYGALAENVSSTCTPTGYEPACLWAYPPTTALLFAPFGSMGVRDGLNALAMFVFMSSTISVVLVGQWMRARAPTTLALALCACVVSHAFVFDVSAGHWEGLGVIGIVLLATGLTERRIAPVVLGALLLSLKPHLYAGLAVVALVLLVTRRDWRTVMWTVGVVGAVNGLALLRYPEALNAILGRAGQVTGLGWATTSAFASSISPSPVIGVVVVYAVGAIAFAAAVRSAPVERRQDVLVAAGAAVALMVSPYVHPYDFLILFPAFASAMALNDRVGPPARAVLLALTAGTLAVGSWLAILGTRIVPPLPGVLPVVVLGLLGLAAWTARGQSAEGTFRAIATSAPDSAGSSRP